MASRFLNRRLARTGLIAAAVWLATAQGSARAGLVEGERLTEKERSIISQIDELDRRMADLRIQGRILTGELADVERRLESTRRQTERLTKEESGLRPRLRKRLQALLVHGEAALLRPGLALPRLKEVSFGQQALARMARFDLKLITDYNQLRAELEESEKKRSVRKDEIKVLSSRLKEAQAGLERQRKARAELLLRIHEQNETRQQALAELDQAAESLNKELLALNLAVPVGPAKGGFDKFKGRLPWPHAGRLTKMEGAGRYGVLILTAPGEPVKAVGGGRVIHAGWVKGYGLVVIVDHGDRYYSLLAHLEDLSVRTGEEVGSGQIIGLAGRAGLAEPGVYLEIRHRDKALDPEDWLAKAGG